MINLRAEHKFDDKRNPKKGGTKSEAPTVY